MGKPKKQTTRRRTGGRRSHIVLKLARAVNKKSPVKVRTTKNESGRKKTTASTKPVAKKTVSKKPAPKKAA